MEQTKTFKCPSCDAPLIYDGKSELMRCAYCDAEIDPAIFEEDEAFDADAPRSWKKYGAADGGDWSDGTATLLVCPSCGGEIVCDAETASTVCPYCDNPALITEHLSGAYKPDLLLPFTVDEKTAKASLSQFCRHKLLLPSSFKREHKAEDVRPLFVPYWLFGCDTNSRITYRATRRMSFRRGDYLYTRTSHFKIIRRGRLSFDNIPVDASAKADNTLLESIEPFPLCDALPYSDALLAGAFASRYDDSAEHCSERARERVAESVNVALRQTVIGYHTVFKNDEDIVFTQSDVRYALLPIYFMNAKYKGKNYSFVINGRTGRMSGSLPVSMPKLFGFLGGITALLGTLFSLIAMLAL